MNKQFKFYPLLAILYACSFCASHVLTDRLVVLDGIKMSAGTFVMPLTYFFSDAVAEVYGYERGRQMIWFGLLGVCLFAACVTLVNMLPAPPHWKYTSAYEIVIHPIVRNVVGSTTGLLVGSFVNIYCLTKWKILTKGRHFWLRSLGSTAIGEAIFILLTGIIIFAGVFPWKVIFSIMIMSYLIKLTYGLVIVWPAAIIVSILKKVESVNVFDYATNFNPFRFDTLDSSENKS